MRRFLTLLVTLVVFGVGSALGQTKQVSGVVTSSEDKQPIPGVSVYVKEAPTVGGTTGVDGKYTLKNVPANAKTIVFRFVGYVVQELPYKSELNVSLEPESQKLDEVMVIAYGTTKKESFTGSAEVVSAKKLEKRTVSNVTKALDGLATGVLTTSGGGQPGSVANVIIRGFGSINASANPLYVVDGVPYDGSLSAINPSDIESMSVLKDASAGALYGSRGANGVVMITTKKGSNTNDKVKLNFKGTWGISQRAIPSYETLNQKEWLEYQYQAYKNNEIYKNGVAPADAGAAAINAMINGTSKILGGTSEIYNPYNYKLADLIDPATGKVRSDAQLKWTDNWMDEALADKPLRQDYIVTLTGGNQKTKYMSSFGYLKEEGLLRTTSFDRYSGRVNLESTPNEWMRYGMNANFSQTTSNFLNATGSSTSNVWYSCMLMAPIYPVYIRDASGNLVLDPQGNKQFDYGSNRASGAQQNYNSIATLFADKFSQVNDNLSARTFIDFLDLKEGLFKGLKFTSNFGFDYINQNVSTYENPYFGNAAGSKGRAYKYNYRTLSYTFNQILSYKRSFATDHNIDLTLGHEFYSYKYNDLEAGKSGFPFGGLYELDAASTTISAGSFVDQYKLDSYFSRLNYSFKDRYYFSASFRTDGSSRFYRDSRWGNFWSVGGNWRVSQEEFMKDIAWLNNLSVKASYGLQGNDAVGSYYAWQSLYDLGFPNAGASGGVVSSLQNDKLKWETNKNLNIGVESRIFDRVSVSAEWYKRKTEDMLMNYPIALSLGFTGYNKNIGSMENSGFEVSVSGEVIKQNDLRWTLTLMGSTVKNKVTALADKPTITSGNYIIQVGEVLNSFYLPLSAGVDPANGKQLYWAWDTADGPRYKTSSASKASTCRQIVGSRVPDLYGSINNEVKYKNFDLSVLCTYSIGGKMLDGVYNGLLSSTYAGNALSKHLTRSWQQPGDKTDIPMPILASDWTVTDANLINASYFSIKNITLGYNFPKGWLKAAKIENVRLAAVADNLAIFTHLKGMDPQYNFSGGTDYTYTPVRTFSFNVDITF
jgi:TonB-linked outer membrane protein, SusC/RagA family